MEFDLIYPERREDAFDAECIVAAVFFDDEELQAFGVDSDSWELNDAFYDFNQFEKAFELWASPHYLSDFYDQFKPFLEADYWRNISEDTFQREVSQSLNVIRKAILDSFKNKTFHELLEPLDFSDEQNRLSESIRVKLKQGTIEIEEKKCYLITGATIKVHKDMGKADNTRIELKKLDYTLQHIKENTLDTKDVFVTQVQ